LISTRPVSLIDEPELCLHPPQAYHMGRFIGKYATSEHVTFVATHSSYILRGILETGNQVTVVRLTRDNKRFSGKVIAEGELIDRVKNPKNRAESILDGLFSKGVVLVESEGDREEYQAAAEAIADFPAREIQFVPVGGTGGFQEPLRFYRCLNIPTAIIADLDMLCDTQKVTALASTLAKETDDINATNQKLRILVDKIKSLPPPITELDAAQTLKQLSETSRNWKNGDDNVLRRQLNDLEGSLKRIGKLKEGGVSSYKDNAEVQSLLLDLLERYAQVGLFFVPVGELEDWVKTLMVDVPKNSKSKSDRAAIAAELIREATDKSADIWSFIKGVLDFLQIQPQVTNLFNKLSS
jgi:predicted ATP-dependent endonuclease of OLD family